MIRFWLCLLTLLLAGCQVLNAPNMGATRDAESTALVQEATRLVDAHATDTAQIQRTAQAGATEIAASSSSNRQLLLTVRAVIPPTPVRQVGVAVEGASATVGPGGPQFVSTGVALSVRDSDGCADSLQTQFDAGTPRIYVNTRAVNLPARTVMRVEWLYDGQVVSSEAWTNPNDVTNFCVWFYLDSSIIPFTPGSWIARLYADDKLVEPQAPFTILAG